VPYVGIRLPLWIMSCSQLLVFMYLSGLIFALCKSRGIIPIHRINSIWAVMRRWGEIAATFSMFCPCVPMLCTVICTLTLAIIVISKLHVERVRSLFCVFLQFVLNKSHSVKCSMLFFRPCVNCLEMQAASLNFEIFPKLMKFLKKFSAISFKISVKLTPYITSYTWIIGDSFIDLTWNAL